MTKYAIIVDPLSTGQEYPPAFRAAGVATVAVLTSPEPAEAFAASWHPENMAHVHIWRGDDAALADELRGYDPVCVIPGAETGVEVADRLVEQLLPGTGNVPALGAARRDKWQMYQALRRTGLPHLRQLNAATPDEVKIWLDETGLTEHRLVLKPPKSMGTDNVHIVGAGADWRPAFDAILGEVNKAGIRNDTVLVQEFADGPEFLVDSYSVDGEHGLVDVCRYTKVMHGDRIGIYDCVDFLAPDDPDVAAVWPYVRDVLEAVGIRNGCGHTEVVLTPDGPRLLEIAARPAGGGHQGISEIATGDNHIKRTVAHRVHGVFKPGYELVKHLQGVFISAPVAGYWRNPEVLDPAEKLPTYAGKLMPRGTGWVPETVDLFTYLAAVILVSDDIDAIRADFAEVKELERQLRIDPAPPPEH